VASKSLSTIQHKTHIYLIWRHPFGIRPYCTLVAILVAYLGSNPQWLRLGRAVVYDSTSLSQERVLKTLIMSTTSPPPLHGLHHGFWEISHLSTNSIDNRAGIYISGDISGFFRDRCRTILLAMILLPASLNKQIAVCRRIPCRLSLRKYGGIIR